MVCAGRELGGEFAMTTPSARYRPETTAATVDVGIFAHNEEMLIPTVIDAFLSQRTASVRIREIIVISCGSTDRTVAAARTAARSSPLVRVIDRPRREGKASAINHFLTQARGDIVVISGADTVPAADAVERLSTALLPPGVAGMAGGKVVPVLQGDSMVERLHRLLWEMHHLVSLRDPKLGELVALRRELAGHLPPDIHCDELAFEWMVKTAGLVLHYDVEHTVGNFAPRDLAGLYLQRRRIACQHVAARRQLGYVPATRSWPRRLAALNNLLKDRPHVIIDLLALAAVELLARGHGALDHRQGVRYRTWRSIPSRCQTPAAVR
jgi:cellulose synthase/poly-beta-1,6-N-acetylglucosamine synthase-like glycosyltransferase